MVANNFSPSSHSSRKGTLTWLKRALSLALFGVLVYFFLPLVKEIKAAAELFWAANWIWLGVAVLVQVISYASLTWLNALALEPFSGKIKFGTLAAVLTSMAFIQVAIPSAGLSGVALRVHLLRKYSYAPEESLFSLMVETVLEIIALVSVALLGVAYLLRVGGLSVKDVVLFSFLCVLLAGVLWYGWWLLNHPARSQIILASLVAGWNRSAGRFRRLDYNKLKERLALFQENLTKYQLTSFMKLVLAAYGKVILDVLTLGVCFYLFRYAISPPTLFLGYGLILTFSGSSALPGGAGMTDAFVPVLFSWISVPGAVALAAGLTYRLIAFWLVRFVGFISWQVLENR